MVINFSLHALACNFLICSSNVKVSEDLERTKKNMTNYPV